MNRLTPDHGADGRSDRTTNGPSMSCHDRQVTPTLSRHRDGSFQSMLAGIRQVSGVYCLVLRLDQSHCLRIGKLGYFDFPRGWYLYFGSAANRGGMRARIRRHLLTRNSMHWHIDYFRQAAKIIEVWTVPGDRQLEHRWAQAAINSDGITVPAAGFGSSDCRAGCRAHLAAMRHRPNPRLLSV